MHEGIEVFNEKSSLDYILKQFPKFHDTVWKDHLAFWGNEEPGYWNNISAFAYYIMLLITENGDSNEIANAFRLAEEMIEKGNENVKTRYVQIF